MMKLWRRYYQRAYDIAYPTLFIKAPVEFIQFFYTKATMLLQLRSLYDVVPAPCVDFIKHLTACPQPKLRTLQTLLQYQSFINYRLMLATLLGQVQLSLYVPFTKVLIIRGIGYRAAIVLNEYLSFYGTEDNIEYGCNKYLLLRAGHSYQTYIGLFNNVGIRLLRKERKIVLYGFNANLVSLNADLIHQYRAPNTFTGRGFRFKGRYYRRKLGKRGQLKGRIW